MSGRSLLNEINLVPQGKAYLVRIDRSISAMENNICVNIVDENMLGNYPAIEYFKIIILDAPPCIDTVSALSICNLQKKLCFQVPTYQSCFEQRYIVGSVSDPDPGILTMLDPDPGKSRLRIRILDEEERKKNEPFFLKFNILFLYFDAALTEAEQ